MLDALYSDSILVPLLASTLTVGLVRYLGSLLLAVDGACWPLFSSMIIARRLGLLYLVHPLLIWVKLDFSVSESTHQASVWSEHKYGIW